VSLDSDVHAIILSPIPKCVSISMSPIPVTEYFLTFLELPVLGVSRNTREWSILMVSGFLLSATTQYVLLGPNAWLGRLKWGSGYGLEYSDLDDFTCS